MRAKTNITLHPTVKAQALDLAKSQGRSLSELVERLLEKEVGKQTSSHYDAVVQVAKSCSTAVHEDLSTSTYFDANSSGTKNIKDKNALAAVLEP